MLSSPGVILGDFQDQGDDDPPPGPSVLPTVVSTPFLHPLQPSFPQSYLRPCHHPLWLHLQSTDLNPDSSFPFICAVSALVNGSLTSQRLSIS